MASISSILSSALDFDKTSEKTSEEQTKSASSMLLEERQRSKKLLEELDFIPVSNAVKRSDPLLDQISSSSVDAPTYWKDAAKEKTSKVGPTMITMRGLPPSNIQSKKKQEQKRKGEEYKDKLLEKHASKTHRKERMDRMKKMY